MKLVTDTNILVRCSRGKAMKHAKTLRQRGIELVTTDRNTDEFLGVLISVFGFDERTATVEVARVMQPFEIVDGEIYDHLEILADRLLDEGGKPDWPVLAAAMALDAEIWSQDLDFFGVGVPVWSTRNIHFAGVPT